MTQRHVHQALCVLLGFASFAGGCNDMDTDLDQQPGAANQSSGTPSTSYNTTSGSGSGASSTSSSGGASSRPYRASVGPSSSSGPSTSASSSTDGTFVTTGDGELEGVSIGDSVHAFLGIPYASPPVGDLRFARAQPPEPWKVTRPAKEFGARCAQLASATLPSAGSESEDCLYLNVWTPASPGKQLPVMVWLHGGGHVNGSASEPVPDVGSGAYYSGEHLAAEKQVVVVTLNYRLGVFGFLAQSRLATEGSDSGNQGLWDQQLALQWVQSNIVRFGGDPTQVTIFGQSAGAFDVCAHVASRSSRDLFQYAIGESGGCTTYQPTLEQAEQATVVLAAKLGCPDENVLACLRGQAVADLLNGSALDPNFVPVVDGKFLKDQPRRLFDAGDINRVPYLLGSNTDEGTYFTARFGSIDTEAAFRDALANNLSVPVDEVIQHYPLGDFSNQDQPYLAALSRILGDSALVCTTYDTALRNANAGSDTYLYNFDIAANTTLGATHGAELGYVFGTTPVLTTEQRAVSDRMQDYWTNFASQGDPNGSNLLNWPLFDADDQARLNIGTTTKVVRDFRAAQCEFWQQVYAAGFANSN